MMDAVSISETSVYFYETIRRSIPECCDLLLPCSRNKTECNCLFLIIGECLDHLSCSIVTFPGNLPSSNVSKESTLHHTKYTN
jgi:hypothetical protein